MAMGEVETLLCVEERERDRLIGQRDALCAVAVRNLDEADAQIRKLNSIIAQIRDSDLRIDFGRRLLAALVIPVIIPAPTPTPTPAFPTPATIVTPHAA